MLWSRFFVPPRLTFVVLTAAYATAMSVRMDTPRLVVSTTILGRLMPGTHRLLGQFTRDVLAANVDDAGEPLDCADYADPAWDFDAYVRTYDPGRLPRRARRATGRRATSVQQQPGRAGQHRGRVEHRRDGQACVHA